MGKQVTWVGLPSGKPISVHCFEPRNSFERDNRAPIVAVLGYGCSDCEIPYGELLQRIATGLGVPVYVLEYANRPDPYLIDTGLPIFKNTAQEWKQYLVQLVIEQVAQASPTGKVCVLGYSEGAMHAVITAYENPGLIERLILIGGAGYSGKESVISIAMRATLNAIDRKLLKSYSFPKSEAKRRIAAYETSIREYQHIFFGRISSFKRGWCSTLDAITPGRVDVLDQLEQISETCGVLAIHYRNDKMLSWKPIKQRLTGMRGVQFILLPGFHSEPMVNPEMTITAILAHL